MGFQRARSEEQRAERRRAILDAAAAMLADMPVADVSLNELSRRVGLAKSNVLRYFETREAVLLELLDVGTGEWLDSLAELPPVQDVDAFAALLARTIAARPVLCDLAAAQSAVLERNVSVDVVLRHKRAFLGHAGRFAVTARRLLPALDESTAQRFVAGAMLAITVAGAHCRANPVLEAAYAADPALEAMRLDLEPVLTELLAVLLAGFLARPDEESRLRL